jgi:diguanylate cyclase (GGDEF)-like protein/PAS domain S-box-containing protein
MPGRIKVGMKLSGIVAAFLGVSALLLYLLIVEKNIAIRFAEKEVAGDVYLRALTKLRESLHQDERNEGKSGAVASSARPTSAEAEFAALSWVDKTLNKELETGARVQELRTLWKKTRDLRLTAAERHEATARLAAGLRDLFSHVGDKSNLILDPDLDSYYLMDANLLRLPEEQDLLQKTTIRITEALRNGRLDAQERTALTVNLVLLRSHMTGLEHDMEVAYRENAARNIQPALETPFARRQEAVRLFVSSVEAALSAKPGAGPSPALLRAQGEQALTESYRFWHRTTDQLDVLLHARIAGFQLRKRNALAGVAIVLLPALLFGILLTRSIALTLKRVAQRLEQLRATEITQLEQGIAALANGDLSAEVVTSTVNAPALRVRSRDELGTLASSLNALSGQTLSTINSFRRTQKGLAEAQAAVRESEARFRSVVEGLGEGILITDFSDNILYVNSRLTELTGYSEEEMLGQTAYSLILPREEWQSVPRRAEQIQQGSAQNYEISLRRKDEAQFWAVIHATPFLGGDGSILGTLSAITDASDKKRFEEQLEHQAFHDTLTGLPNRALFMECLERALARSKRTGMSLVVLFLDLDNFKLVNDSLGHEAGDTLLVEVGRRLNECIRSEDVVARLGGDEFSILLEDVTEPDRAADVAERILNSLRTPVEIGYEEIFATASIGIACNLTSPAVADALLRDADTAMYQAKARGKTGYAIFDKSMNDRVMERMEIENGLRFALERGEFRVHYQPLISLETGAMTGVEALVRWEHPTMGLIAPGRFIPIAEETGLIVPLGYWVLEEACLQWQTWRSRFPIPSEFSVSVNLSGKQLQRTDVVEKVRETLERTEVPPGNLKLEITESMMMADVEDAVAKLHQLKALGVKLALDDFGTGYSSMASLSAFPLDTVKIDRAFIKRLTDQQEASSVITAIIMLAKSLNMDVTGEGVETEEQVSHLQWVGCTTGQGYYFAKPMPAPSLDNALASGEKYIKHRETFEKERIEALLLATGLIGNADDEEDEPPAPQERRAA